MKKERKYTDLISITWLNILHESKRKSIVLPTKQFRFLYINFIDDMYVRTFVPHIDISNLVDFKFNILR